MLNIRKCGFTLVELLVTVSIFLILIIALFTVLIAGRNSWQVGDVRIELQQDLRKAMDWMAEELRQSGSSKISNVPADGSPYETITFRIPDDVVGGEIVWETEQIQYLLGGLNGRQLLRRVNGEEKVLANNIASFQVRRQSSTPEIVEMSLQAEKNTGRGNLISLNLNFQVKLRN